MSGFRDHLLKKTETAMGFSCLKNDKRIYSFTYSLKDWISLKEEKSADFKTSCCGADAILKTSKLGTQFFAHKRKPKEHDCRASGETAEHIHIKYLVSKKLFDCGWHVEVEKKGVSSKGEAWIADVYAEKGNAKIAIEVQWSRQSFIETKRRQQVYADSGVRCAWLLRNGSIKDRDAIVGDYRYNTKSIPVFSIYKNKRNNRYEVMLFKYSNSKCEISKSQYALVKCSLPLDSFVENLVSSNIKFIKKHSPYSGISLIINDKKCWRCSQTTRVVSRCFCSNTQYGWYSHDDSFHVYIENANKELIDFINDNFSKTYNFKPIRRRHDKLSESSYVANSCYHCDALMSRNITNDWDLVFFHKPESALEVEIPKTKIPLLFSHLFYIETYDLDIGKWILINPST